MSLVDDIVYLLTWMIQHATIEINKRFLYNWMILLNGENFIFWYAFDFISKVDRPISDLRAIALMAGSVLWYEDIMKLFIHFTAIIFFNTINKSFLEGQVPDLLKIAEVCHVFKNGDKSLISNYRPTYVLQRFSKIFEHIVNNWLISYLTNFKILNSNQFGFRNKYSTAMAILEMVDKISDAMDKYYSHGVFIDLSKAFDTLDHNILLGKL